jgi:hypothetical protein
MRKVLQQKEIMAKLLVVNISLETSWYNDIYSLI